MFKRIKQAFKQSRTQFSLLKEFREHEKQNPDGIFLVIRKYPYRIEIGKNKASMGIDSLDSGNEDDNRRWVKRSKGKVELVSIEDMKKELGEKREEIMGNYSEVLNRIFS